MKRALITGINGQDGSYLAEYLLKLGYDVFGTVRSGSTLENIRYIRDLVELISCDVRDAPSVVTAVKKVSPDEVYNFAGQSFQPVGWTLPSYTLEANTIGLMNVIYAINVIDPNIRLFQASAAGMFGARCELHATFCNEDTEFNPRSPYDVSKLAAHALCKIYRAKGMYISTGILFSHESPRRGIEMLSRKISSAVAEWACHGMIKKLRLGDISMSRDWGCAIDFVKGMHASLQVDHPSDYVFGSGESHSIEEFLDEAVIAADLGDWREMVEFDARFVRGEKFTAIADCTRAESLLGWKHKTTFKQLVEMMVKSDIARKKNVQTSNVV